jgi:hypothetical protein
MDLFPAFSYTAAFLTVVTPAAIGARSRSKVITLYGGIPATSPGCREGLVLWMVKYLRRVPVLLPDSRITLGEAITRRQLRGTLETLMNETETAREASPGASTNI